MVVAVCAYRRLFCVNRKCIALLQPFFSGIHNSTHIKISGCGLTPPTLHFLGCVLTPPTCFLGCNSTHHVSLLWLNSTLIMFSLLWLNSTHMLLLFFAVTPPTACFLCCGLRVPIHRPCTRLCKMTSWLLCIWFTLFCLL